PHQYAYRGPGQLVDMPEPLVTDFVRDLTEGIGGTGVKAAFLKCCLETREPSPGAERVARAVARAHRETGAPITVHTSGARQTGRHAVRIFAEEGVDLAKVVIGHAGDSNDLDYLTELADQGVLLGMDRFGLEIYNPGTERIKTVAALAARGYAASMVLSHDASCFIDWFGGAHDEVRALLPDWQYEHISDDVLPALLAAGVTQSQLDTMLTANPARYFSPG
ncbi:MAG: phosphotriesterase-related protein, partial [Actinobacteria bacterium]|nr:phosphotriesterase-related protein [Actinomycetota bacterium]